MTSPPASVTSPSASQPPAFVPALPLSAARPRPSLASSSPIGLAKTARPGGAVRATAQPPFPAVPVPTVSSEQLKSRALAAWLSDNGMYLTPEASWGRPMHPLAIADDTTDDGESCGRGLVAGKSILQNECLFEVPVSVLLTKDVALTNLPMLSPDVNEYVAIAALLIAERAKGSDSFWAPYIDILPNDDELRPLFRWPAEDLELLRGSPALSAASSLSAKLRAEFASAEESIFQADRKTFPEDVFNFNAWEWAFAVLFSRAISLTADRIIALVPYADLINHNPFCSNYIDTHSEFLTGDRYVRLYSDRPYALSDQVFVTYGPKPNGDLLLLYGFVSDRNPFDSVDLNVALDEGDDPVLYERKKKYLQESGVGEVAAFPLYRDRYPMEMVEFLRFCFADASEFDTADFGDFVTEKNETRVANAIIDACEQAIEAYPQTREQDDKIMADTRMFQTLSQAQRWAVRQRRAEKRILQRTINTIKREMVSPTFMFTESEENT